MERMTRKQKEFIEAMQEFGMEEFRGATKKEASEYISKNIELFKLYSQTGWQLSKL